MAKVGITETVLRDAHQSLIATRMRTDEFEGILEKMDKIGYHSLECWGGATFGKNFIKLICLTCLLKL